MIKPDIEEKIQEDLPTYPGWAAQNEDNCDVIDNLFRRQNNTYVPVWTGSGGNPTIGAGGSIVGSYIRLHPGMVYAWIKLNMGGAGFATGGGTYRFTLPVAACAELNTFTANPCFGKAYFFDATAALTSTDMTVLYDGNIQRLFLRKQDGDTWTATSPVVPAQNDKMSLFFCYPTSVA